MYFIENGRLSGVHSEKRQDIFLQNVMAGENSDHEQADWQVKPGSLTETSSRKPSLLMIDDKK